jgi:hypothetical protein
MMTTLVGPNGREDVVMPIHDWTRVDAGTFHAFHTVWIAEIMKALNDGLLPEGYYALAEQVASRMQTDVLTLRVPRAQPLPPPRGGVAVAEAPPTVSRTTRPDPQRKPRRAMRRGRHLVVRHTSGHQVVALVKIVSPANKDRKLHVRQFAEKVAASLEANVHVLLLDLLPPTPYDPHGMHGAVWGYFDTTPVEVMVERPLMLASYAWDGEEPEAYLEPVAVGQRLIDMPLFLTAERYVNVPLEATYRAAYRGMPRFWARRTRRRGRHFAGLTSQSLIVPSLPAEASIFPSVLNTTHFTLSVCPLSMAFCSPRATSQSLILLSWLPEASVFPSGLNATDNTASVCPLRAASSLPVATSHSLIDLSLLAEASVLPSGLKTTDATASVCPLSVACLFPVATSHSLIDLSLLAEASVLPSGLNATDKTEIVWPLRVSFSLPVGTSHSLTVWSQPPEASVLPSGLKVTDITGPPCPLRVAFSFPVATSHNLISPTLAEASV